MCENDERGSVMALKAGFRSGGRNHGDDFASRSVVESNSEANSSDDGGGGR